VAQRLLTRDVVAPPRPRRVRAEPYEPLLEQAPRQRWWSPLLRDGIRPLVLATDLAACTLAATLTGIPATLAVVFTTMVLMGHSVMGLYKSRLSLSALDDCPRLVSGSAMAFSGTVLLGMLLESPVQPHGWAWFAGLSTLLLIALRALAYAVVRWLRTTGRVAHRTLVVGSGAIGQELAQTLLAHPKYGLRPVGFLDAPRPPHHGLPLPVVGNLADLPRLLEDTSLRAVVLAYGRMGESDLVQLIRTSHRARCDVFVVPRLYEVHHVGHDMESVWGTPLVRLSRAAHRRVDWQMKRLLDIVLSFLAIVLVSPVMALCAAAVYREGGPGVIFRQVRVGCDGRRFSVMKFRTLRPVDETESRTNWNIAHDDRLGPVGRFLRKSSLDELPQLFNILKGDMSLVGPRPERPHFVEEFSLLYPSYSARDRVPCGLTGWAQVHGLRGDTSIADRAKFDNFYIENWSLWFDVKIMLRTVVALVRSPGA
jgi:exopolysaccharide biosynthesis polyprenyl glycosylphosphotransferase